MRYLNTFESFFKTSEDDRFISNLINDIKNISKEEIEEMNIVLGETPEPFTYPKYTVIINENRYDISRHLFYKLETILKEKEIDINYEKI